MATLSTPKKVILEGDKALASSHIGEADSLLNIVAVQAGFQNLSQHMLRRQLQDGTIIVASLAFGQGQVRIFGPTTKVATSQPVIAPQRQDTLPIDKLTGDVWTHVYQILWDRKPELISQAWAEAEYGRIIANYANYFNGAEGFMALALNPFSRGLNYANGKTNADWIAYLEGVSTLAPGWGGYWVYYWSKYWFNGEGIPFFNGFLPPASYSKSPGMWKKLEQLCDVVSLEDGYEQTVTKTGMDYDITRTQTVEFENTDPLFGFNWKRGIAQANLKRTVTEAWITFTGNYDYFGQAGDNLNLPNGVPPDTVTSELRRTYDIDMTISQDEGTRLWTNITGGKVRHGDGFVDSHVLTETLTSTVVPLPPVMLRVPDTVVNNWPFGPGFPPPRGIMFAPYYVLTVGQAIPPPVGGPIVIQY